MKSRGVALRSVGRESSVVVLRRIKIEDSRDRGFHVERYDS